MKQVTKERAKKTLDDLGADFAVVVIAQKDNKTDCHCFKRESFMNHLKECDTCRDWVIDCLHEAINDIQRETVAIPEGQRIQ